MSVTSWRGKCCLVLLQNILYVGMFMCLSVSELLPSEPMGIYGKDYFLSLHNSQPSFRIQLRYYLLFETFQTRGESVSSFIPQVFTSTKGLLVLFTYICIFQWTSLRYKLLIIFIYPHLLCVMRSSNHRRKIMLM